MTVFLIERCCRQIIICQLESPLRGGAAFLMFLKEHYETEAEERASRVKVSTTTTTLNMISLR